MSGDHDSSPTADLSDPSARLRRAKEVYLSVRTLGLAEREETLERLCAGDGALKREVLLLLRGEGLPLSAERLADDLRAARSALGAAVGAGGGAGAGLGDRLEGSMVGRYRLLERLGEGGFGVVFMAEQVEPVRRTVAVKVLKMGMDTDQIVARFESERQALALMDHANIAKVLDGGTTESGRPYFVMELVKGEPITAFCDRNKLRVNERLELFASVCAAVQHAHTKGVIHRDLKPGNVLVSFVDGVAVPKVIDFGIAKAVDRPLTDKAYFTEFRQLIGTPEYMSPEQAVGSRDIDTRSDVYSLGVVLYELLTGATPFEATRLRSAAYAEIQRIIQEEEPARPSTRLSGSAEKLTTVATLRRATPNELTSLVKRELDWVVMRALEKDRSRRYGSPAELMADVRRFVAGEAVQAVPPSAAYRAKKFVRRHRVGVTAAGLVALSLVVGLGAAVQQAGAARRERAEAVAQKAEAEQRAEDLRRVLAFIDGALGKTFGVFDTEVSKLKGSLRAREALAEAMRRQASEAPEVAADAAALLRFKASALERTGDLRGGVRSPSTGDLRGAREAYAEALAIRKGLVEKSPEDAGALTDLAMVHRRLADLATRGEDAAGAAAEIGKARELLARASSQGEAGVPAKRLLAAMDLQEARRLLDSGAVDEAARAYTAVEVVYGDLLRAAPDDRAARRDASMLRLHLGDLAAARGDAVRALAEYDGCLRLAEALAAEEPSDRSQRDVAVARYSRATALLALGRKAEAEKEVGEAIRLLEELRAEGVKAAAGDARLERDLTLFRGFRTKLSAGDGEKP